MAENKRLRVLQVMRAPVGGLFRHVTDLTEALAARGHDVGIVVDSSLGNAGTKEQLTALRTSASLGIHRFPIPRILGPNDIVTPWRVRALARKLDVDILHGHGAKGGFAARLANLGAKSSATLYTPHGGALHFDPRKPSGALFMVIERVLLAATDALIFESAHASRAYREKVAQPRCMNRIIHNGVSEAEFDPITPGAADFVFVGELRMLKGIDILFEALEPLKDLGGKPASLVVAGDGPDASTVKSMISTMGLSERVNLIGATPAREAFAQGRCVVVPSRAESLPYVVLEAAAAARPVIATNVGGIPEIFGPHAASLTPPDDAAALSRAMADYLERPDALESTAAAHQRYVSDRFSIRTMAEQIEALYRDLVRAESSNKSVKAITP